MSTQRADELRFRPRCRARSVRTCRRAGPEDEFPERIELLELRLVGIVVMRGGIVHVGGQPYRVDDAGALDGAAGGRFELSAAADRRPHAGASEPFLFVASS